jgi:hypothetical protein
LIQENKSSDWRSLQIFPPLKEAICLDRELQPFRLGLTKTRTILRFNGG